MKSNKAWNHFQMYTYIDNSARGAGSTGGRSRGDALRGGSRHLETKIRWE